MQSAMPSAGHTVSHLWVSSDRLSAMREPLSNTMHTLVYGSICRPVMRFMPAATVLLAVMADDFGLRPMPPSPIM